MNGLQPYTILIHIARNIFLWTLYTGGFYSQVSRITTIGHQQPEHRRVIQKAR